MMTGTARRPDPAPKNGGAEERPAVDQDRLETEILHLQKKASFPARADWPSSNGSVRPSQVAAGPRRTVAASFAA